MSAGGGASGARLGGMVVTVVVGVAAMFATAAVFGGSVRHVAYAVIGFAGFGTALRGTGGGAGAGWGRRLPAPVRLAVGAAAFLAVAYGAALYLGESFGFVARVPFVAGVLSAFARVLAMWMEGPGGTGTGRGA